MTTYHLYCPYNDGHSIPDEYAHFPVGIIQTIAGNRRLSRYNDEPSNIVRYRYIIEDLLPYDEKVQGFLRYRRVHQLLGQTT